MITEFDIEKRAGADKYEYLMDLFNQSAISRTVSSIPKQLIDKITSTSYEDMYWGTGMISALMRR